jgi:hypothetical protein
MGTRLFKALALAGLLTPGQWLHASAGTEGASFLDVPVGAGPAALGSAYTALATDAYAPTTNPAGLGFLKGVDLAAQHLSYIQSIRYEHFGVAVPIFQGREGSLHHGLGFSIQDLGSGDIARTDVSNGSPVTGLGSYSSHWDAYNLSYGQTVTDKLGLGLTGKLIHASIDDVSASAYGMDFGSLYRWTDRLTLAATLTNLGTKLKFINNGDSLPLAFHTAAAYRPSSHWVMTSEGVFRKTGLNSVHVGTQWQPVDAISLRVGYRTDTLKGLSALAGFTTGVGIRAWGQELAYAWVPYGELGNSQYLSLVMHFGDRSGTGTIIRAAMPAAARARSEISMVTEEQRMLQLLEEPKAEY